jgi:hypothetical protein
VKRARSQGPVRLQLSRRRGFQLQALSRRINGLEAVVVARPGPFGNPFAIAWIVKMRLAENRHAARAVAVAWFADWLEGKRLPHAAPSRGLAAKRSEILRRMRALRGKNLACWCKPDETCHADILIEFAKRVPIADDEFGTQSRVAPKVRGTKVRLLGRRG